MLEDLGESALDRLIHEETTEELLSMLTERQRIMIHQFYFQRKTQKEISEEFEITTATIREILDRAIQRIQKKYGLVEKPCQCGKRVDCYEREKTKRKRSICITRE